MKTQFACIVAIAVAALFTVTMLGACNRSDGQTSQQHAPAAPKVAESPASPPPTPPAADSQSDKSETANANDPPMKSMSPKEEATSIPQPGQANDHSTVAGDGKK